MCTFSSKRSPVNDRVSTRALLLVLLLLPNAQPVLALAQDAASQPAGTVTPTVATSQPAGLTVEAALQRTLRAHIALSAYPLWQRQAAAQQLRAAITPTPELQVNVENIAGSGDSRGIGGAELTVAISQLFEAGSKPAARLAEADATLSQTEARYQLALADAFAQTRQHFVRQLLLQARLALLSQHQQQISSALAEAEQRARAGVSPHSDVLRLQSRALQNLLATQQLAANLQQAQAELAALWGESPQFNQLAGDLTLLPELPAAADALAALQQAPQLQWWLTSLRLAESAEQLAIANGARDFTLSAGLKRDQRNQETSVLLGISLPLYSAAQVPNRADVAESSARRAELALQTAQQQQQLQLAVQAQLVQLKLNRQYLHDLQSGLIPLQQQMVSAVQQHYSAGLVDMNGLLSAQQELLDSQLQRLDGLAAFHSQLIELQRLTGLPLALRAGLRLTAASQLAATPLTGVQP